MDKAFSYLGIARKAGLLLTGQDQCAAAAEAGRVRLMLLPSDVSPNARHRAEAILRGRRAPLVTLPWTGEELAERLGRPGCSMLCFTDLPLAARFASAMAENHPLWQETAELLSRREDKARRRKAAPRKHETRQNRRT